MLSNFLHNNSSTSLTTFVNTNLRHSNSSLQINCACAKKQQKKRLYKIKTPSHLFGFRLKKLDEQKNFVIHDAYLYNHTAGKQGGGYLHNIECQCATNTDDTFSFTLDNYGQFSSLEMTHKHMDAIGNSYLHAGDGAITHTHTNVVPDCSGDGGSDGVYIVVDNKKTNYCCTRFDSLSGKCVDSTGVCSDPSGTGSGDGPDNCLIRFPKCEAQPAPGTHPMYFGTWYSKWCGVCGNAARMGASCRAGEPDPTVTSDTPAALLPIQPMLDMLIESSRSKNLPLPEILSTAVVNSAASLGIGGSPSYMAINQFAAKEAEWKSYMSNLNNPNKWSLADGTWEANMCKQTSTFKDLNVQFKILNIGGWGAPNDKFPACSPWCSSGCNTILDKCDQSANMNAGACLGCQNQGVPAALWRKQDIPTDDDLKVIAGRLNELGYNGIAFDIEGMTQDFVDNINVPGGFLPQVGKLRNLDFLQKNDLPNNAGKGWQVWIIVPGFNEINTPGVGEDGKVSVTSKPFTISDHRNIDIIQFMIYGQGLDSNYAGDPTMKNANGTPCSETTTNQTESCMNQVIDGTLTALSDPALADVPAYKKMIALSMTNYDEPANFMTFMKKVWPKANGGLFSWCTGEDESWDYGACNYGSCSNTCSAPKIAGAPPPPPPCPAACWAISGGSCTTPAAAELCTTTCHGHCISGDCSGSCTP